MIHGVRLPKRLREESDRAPKITLEIRAKMMPMEFIVPRMVSPWPMPSVSKRAGSSTVEPMVPDIIKMTQKKMKPAPKRPRFNLLTGLPVSGASSSLVIA